LKLKIHHSPQVRAGRDFGHENMILGMILGMKMEKQLVFPFSCPAMISGPFSCRMIFSGGQKRRFNYYYRKCPLF